MSRIGKKPVAIPAGVEVTVQDRTVQVKGPKGTLRYTHRPEVKVELLDGHGNKQLLVSRTVENRMARALHGLTRALLQNMVTGVVQGYEKRLEIVGVGYLAAVQGRTLELRVGFAHEVKVPIPEGLEVTCPDQTHIVIRGCDKQLVGQFAAAVRAVRKPEPYKGKGIRYQGEHVKLKPGKTTT
ncbi:MAG: 50S ribosomal protein L6 [Pirellulaceae bacterium]|nr:MAG: 50S ribosomal protein L6 [Pirellulaceae bacterium]